MEKFVSNAFGKDCIKDCIESFQLASDLDANSDDDQSFYNGDEEMGMVGSVKESRKQRRRKRVKKQQRKSLESLLLSSDDESAVQSSDDSELDLEPDSESEVDSDSDESSGSNTDDSTEDDRESKQEDEVAELCTLEKDANGTFPSTQCQLCDQMPTNHYCQVVDGTQICGTAFCVLCKEKLSADEDYESNRVCCPLHYLDQLANPEGKDLSEKRQDLEKLRKLCNSNGIDAGRQQSKTLSRLLKRELFPVE